VTSFAVAVILILLPHPSLLIVLINFHIQTLHAPITFFIHVLVTYTLTFLAFSSLIVCVVRDPGPVNEVSFREDNPNPNREMVTLTEALMNEDDQSGFEGWCNKCSVRPSPQPRSM